MTMFAALVFWKMLFSMYHNQTVDCWLADVILSLYSVSVSKLNATIMFRIFYNS